MTKEFIVGVIASKENLKMVNCFNGKIFAKKCLLLLKCGVSRCIFPKCWSQEGWPG